MCTVELEVRTCIVLLDVWYMHCSTGGMVHALFYWMYGTCIVLLDV